MFNSSKYTKWYDLIILRAQQRAIVNEYSERHHIIPKCLGGTNKKTNMVVLTAKEHFICHLLLPKMVDDGVAKSKMWHAAWCLMSMKGSTGNRVFKYGARSFAIIREHRSKQVIKMRTGKLHTDETKQKIGEKSRQKVYSAEYRQKLSIAGLNRRDSEEVKQRKSEAAKLRWTKVSFEDRQRHVKAATSARHKP